MTSNYFSDFDFDGFWYENEYADTLSEPAPSNEMIASIEEELGYRLPAAYIELSRIKNGGLPRKCYHASPCQTSYGAEDHIEIAEVYAIGRTAPWALGKEGCNTAFWVEECGYPPIGIYFGNCPDHGHQMLAFDYRQCGPEGEPSVVVVDEIEDYEIIPLAKNFEEFIRGLKPEGFFESDFD
ncbi:SMI1/KNR4 family protein [bacterium]|nr:SMI1/KNR4 family protein [bacterium]